MIEKEFFYQNIHDANLLISFEAGSHKLRRV